MRGHLLSLTVRLALTRIHFRLPSMRELEDTAFVCAVSNKVALPIYVRPPLWPHGVLLVAAMGIFFAQQRIESYRTRLLHRVASTPPRSSPALHESEARAARVSVLQNHGSPSAHCFGSRTARQNSLGQHRQSRKRTRSRGASLDRRDTFFDACRAETCFPQTANSCSLG
jgi:hypothetical protein